MPEHSETTPSGTDAEASTGEAIERLLSSFARVQDIDDPIERALASAREAEAAGLDSGLYLQLFEVYEATGRARRRRLERQLRRVVEWCRDQSFFDVLEYVGRLAIVVAILSFFAELPERRAMRQGEAWEGILAASGEPWSGDRQDDIERLDAACSSLEGLPAPGAHLEDLRLDHCRGPFGGVLSGTWLASLLPPRGAILIGANLENAVLTRAVLPRADLGSARLGGVDLSHADLSEARLVDADLVGADLSNADLSGADLRGADLSNADLTRANLEGATLEAATLDGARLLFANLRDGVARHASLRQVKLSGARLNGTNLFAADLTDADFRHAHFDGATIVDHVRWTGARIDRGALSDDQLHAADNRPALQAASVAGTTIVGMIAPQHTEFFEQVHNGGVVAAEKAGASVAVVYLDQIDMGLRTVGALAFGFGGLAQPSMRLAEQIAVTQLMAEGIEALVLDPLGSGTDDTIHRAVEAGIPVVCFDHGPSDPTTKVLVSEVFTTDQYAMGYDLARHAARWAARQRDRGDEPWRVGLVRACDFEDCFRRVEGFRAGLGDSGLDWHETFYRRVRVGEDQFQVIRDVIADHPTVEIVWSANELGTVGVLEAVGDLGLRSQVRVFGTDWSERVARDLAGPADDRTVQAIVVQSPRRMGELAVAAALAEIDGAAPSFGFHALPHRIVDDERDAIDR